MARKSLRDRNTAAIANEVTPSTDEPRQDIEVRQEHFEAAERLEQEEAAEAPARKAERQSKARVKSGAEDTARLGIYLTPVEFDDARASYLADWANGGDADTFARWIAGALDRHAARTPKQRAARDRLRGRSDARTGSTRSFSIPTSTMQRMRAAITADQQAGRWPSDSAWCAEAIALAVDDARKANGGTLPTPPVRLPNRLVR
ncbi:hypothetical protein KZC56_17335 [Microbacterium sp. SSW1-47]|uniref:hypothetical protein n=1 Tax=Microbacterium sufflavum TaxID=2851649 RepID=UPI001FFDD941|nr:hypothetical protein [Microbacterium sufflavum]MCK2028063.1 hypothetical protein [Microbacterium sufflavum]